MAIDRRALPTASARSLPLFTCGRTPGPVSNIIDTCPAMRSVIAGGPPLYGTWTRSMPAADLNISIVRWFVRPLPPEA